MEAYEYSIAEALRDCDASEFHAGLGDVLIWHSDLVHGGAALLDRGSTRWSQVTHYFFEGFAYVTPMLSDASTGEFVVREPLVDIARRTIVTHQIGGRTGSVQRLASGKTRFRGGDEPSPEWSTRIASSTRGALRHVRAGLRMGHELLGQRGPLSLR